MHEELHPAWLIGLSAGLALLPMLVGMLTSYVKISVVLGILRSGLGAQQVPSALVTMVLSVALTAYIMQPVITQSFQEAKDANLISIQHKIDDESLPKMRAVLQPWRHFLFIHSGERERDIFLKDKANLSETSFFVLIPSFVLSELRESFAMAFVVLLPFLAIDLIVGNILVGLGMYMMSPMLISLPLKLLIFVLTDAWLLLIRALISSYGV